MAKPTRRKRKETSNLPSAASARSVAERSKTPPPSPPAARVKRSEPSPSRSVKAESVRAVSDDRLPDTLEQRSESARRRAAYLLGAGVLLFGALYGISKCGSTEETPVKTGAAPKTVQTAPPSAKPLLEPSPLPVEEETVPPTPIPSASGIGIEPEPRILIEPPVPPPAASIPRPGSPPPSQTAEPSPKTEAAQKKEAPPLPKTPPPTVEKPTQAPLPQSGDIDSP